MSDIDDSASRLRAVIRQVMRRADALRTPDAPTRSEQGVLVWLSEQGPMSPKALADSHGVRPQSMQQTLDSLERRRWIKRADHPTDRRQILFSLSPSGRNALEKGRKLRQAWLVSELKKLSPKERAVLNQALGLLERFVETPAKN